MIEQELLSPSIQYIINGLKVEANRSPWALVRLLEQAGVTEKELQPWADFAHPAEDSYGRKLVYADHGFEVMVMSWQPGDFSAIHDHGYTQWGAVQIFGPAEHATFRIEDNKLETTAPWQGVPGSILPVQHDLIHQMGNPSQQPFLSLHIYGLEEEVVSITGDARLFDPVQAKIQRVDGGVFFALPPDQISKIEQGYLGDYPTRLRYLVEDVSRKLKMPAYQQGTKAAALEVTIQEIFDGAFMSHCKALKGGEIPADAVLAQELRAAEKLWQKLGAKYQLPTTVLEC